MLPKKVEREPYTGNVVEMKEPEEFDTRKSDNPILPEHPEFHARPPTRSGARNQQDSSFTLSGKSLFDFMDFIFLLLCFSCYSSLLQTMNNVHTQNLHLRIVIKNKRKGLRFLIRI